MAHHHVSLDKNEFLSFLRISPPSSCFLNLPFSCPFQHWARRRKWMTTTSNDPWMHSWFGPGWSEDRSPRRIPRCTIPRFQSDWVPSGKRWQRLKSALLLMRRSGFGPSICKIIQTTNTDQDGNQRISKLLDIRTQCLIHPSPWKLSEQVSTKYGTYSLAHAIDHVELDFIQLISRLTVHETDLKLSCLLVRNRRALKNCEKLEYVLYWESPSHPTQTNCMWVRPSGVSEMSRTNIQGSVRRFDEIELLVLCPRIFVAEPMLSTLYQRTFPFANYFRVGQTRFTVGN